MTNLWNFTLTFTPEERWKRGLLKRGRERNPGEASFYLFALIFFSIAIFTLHPRSIPDNLFFHSLERLWHAILIFWYLYFIMHHGLLLYKIPDYSPGKDQDTGPEKQSIYFLYISLKISAGKNETEMGGRENNSQISSNIEERNRFL